jgi:hypothetical protein
MKPLQDSQLAAHKTLNETLYEALTETLSRTFKKFRLPLGHPQKETLHRAQYDPLVVVAISNKFRGGLSTRFTILPSNQTLKKTSRGGGLSIVPSSPDETLNRIFH